MAPKEGAWVRPYGRPQSDVMVPAQEAGMGMAEGL